MEAGTALDFTVGPRHEISVAPQSGKFGLDPPGSGGLSGLSGEMEPFGPATGPKEGCQRQYGGFWWHSRAATRLRPRGACGKDRPALKGAFLGDSLIRGTLP